MFVSFPYTDFFIAARKESKKTNGKSLERPVRKKAVVFVQNEGNWWSGHLFYSSSSWIMTDRS